MDGHETYIASWKEDRIDDIGIRCEANFFVAKGSDGAVF
jgi:hypothetical protein